ATSTGRRTAWSPAHGPTSCWSTRRRCRTPSSAYPVVSWWSRAVASSSATASCRSDASASAVRQARGDAVEQAVQPQFDLLVDVRACGVGQPGRQVRQAAVGAGQLVRTGDGGPKRLGRRKAVARSEEHTSELQSRENLVCRL